MRGQLFVGNPLLEVLNDSMWDDWFYCGSGKPINPRREIL